MADTTVRDQLASLVRTAVPYGVGLVLTFLARKWGIVLDEHSTAGLSAGLATLAGTVYYVLVRALETRWRRLGWLLGLPWSPNYTKPQ